MEVVVENTYEKISKKLADLVIEKVNKKPDTVLCVAGGHTPQKFYEYLIEADENDVVDFKQAHFILLDEWVGLDENTFGSCIQSLNDQLFKQLELNYATQIHYFDGKAQVIAHEVSRINALIDQLGGIDISILGIGMNGHIGFNEPGVDESLEVGIVPLDPITTEVGKKYFKEKLNLEFGITIGLKRLMESTLLVLMANGTKKAAIVYDTVYGPVSNQVPSSIARKHKNSFLYLDKKAASKLRGSI